MGTTGHAVLFHVMFVNEWHNACSCLILILPHITVYFCLSLPAQGHPTDSTSSASPAIASASA
jgi:hypothetical protein